MGVSEAFQVFSLSETDLVVGSSVFSLETFVLSSTDLHTLLVGNLLAAEDCAVGGCGAYVFLGEGAAGTGGAGGGFTDC